MKQVKFRVISRLFLVSLISFIISIFLPWVDVTYQYHFIYSTGTSFFILGGYAGIVLMVIATIFFLRYKVRKGLFTAFAGNICLLFNYGFFFTYLVYMWISGEPLGWQIGVGFYVSLVIWIFIIALNISGAKIYHISKYNIVDESCIRRTIINLGTVKGRVHLKQLVKHCGTFWKTTLNIALKMIKEKAIHGEYFKTSNTILFDLHSNIDEIDALMKLYKDWEQKAIGKLKDRQLGLI